jgi:hypothetical protein
MCMPCQSASRRSACRGIISTWTALTRLTLTGSGVRSFAGLEAFTSLEELHAALVAAGDLGPLAGLQRLQDVRLIGLTRVHDLSALGSVPSLRRLEIARAGIEFRDILQLDSLRPLRSARRLEELVLRAAVIRDGDLRPLEELPALRRVDVFGDLAAEVERFKTARPDVVVSWHGGETTPGTRVGSVHVRPPINRMNRWWIREDLTERLGARTNADAERRLQKAIEAVDPELLTRLNFDTEGDAVSVDAAAEEDIRAVAAAIDSLAATRG